MNRFKRESEVCACVSVSVHHVGGRLCVFFKVCEEETSQLVSASISAFLKHPERSAGGERVASKKKTKKQKQEKPQSILLRLYGSYLTKHALVFIHGAQPLWNTSEIHPERQLG